MLPDATEPAPHGVTEQEWAAIQEHAQRIADDWPPLTQEQRDQLRTLLAPSAGGDRDAA